LPQILGCKGLLVTNSKLSNNLVENEDYIYIDKNMDWFKKLLDIIKKNDKYNNIRENGYKKGVEHYTWNNFAHKIDYITKLLSE
jgi:glycosyltransferase involved in cell wall biosynthesis